MFSSTLSLMSAEPLEQCMEAQVLVLNSHHKTGEFKQSQSEKNQAPFWLTFISARILFFHENTYSLLRIVFSRTRSPFYSSCAGVAVKNGEDFCRTYQEEV